MSETLGCYHKAFDAKAKAEGWGKDQVPVAPQRELQDAAPQERPPKGDERAADKVHPPADAAPCNTCLGMGGVMMTDGLGRTSIMPCGCATARSFSTPVDQMSKTPRTGAILFQHILPEDRERKRRETTKNRT